jgi:hypothetical protein
MNWGVFDSEWPDGGHLGGWPPMGLKPADAVLTTRWQRCKK